MLKILFVTVGLLLSSLLNAQNLNLVDLIKLMKGTDVIEKDAYLSQRGFSITKEPNNLNWKSGTTNERVFILIAEKKVNQMEYYTENPNCISSLLNDIEMTNDYQKYYPIVLNKNLLVTSFKNKSNTRFITIKKDITGKYDIGWNVEFSIIQCAEIYN